MEENGTRRPRREQELLEAAAKVFYERGYPNASLRDIADELGILKGSLYHYIKGKDDLLVRLFDELHAEVGELAAAVMSEPGLDPVQRLDTWVRRQVRYNLEHAERIAIYYSELKHVREPQRSAVVERRKATERFVTGLIGDAQDAGGLDPTLDAELVSNCVFATLIWTYRWYRRDGRASAEQVAQECADFVLGGLLIPA